MIRRDYHPVSGNAGWALVSQVEHARLSGEMAAAWGSPAFPPLPHRQQMLPAIVHHDDGWAVWERRPGVDPANGWPLNFTEMPLAESLAIWQRSIDTAAGFGPLAGYMVSGHFSALLRHQNAWQRVPAVHADAARAFLVEQDHCRAEWLDQWQRQSPSQTAAAAETALHWLQFFDALSLWLCTARRTEPHELPVPSDGELRLTPEPDDSPDRERIRLDPWPFSQAELRLSLAARVVPIARYSTPDELAEAPNVPVVLNWLLLAATR